MYFGSVPKGFTTAVFKSKHGQEVIKTLYMKVTPLRYYGILTAHSF